jgi:protocatechuate 3,4-dioxygenase beta subunit
MRPDTAHPDLDPPDPSRRKMIGWVGAAGVAAFVGVPRLTRHEAPLPGSLSCVVRPRQTEGPYFIDAMLNRSDIRQDPTDGTVVEGLPLQVKMSVHRMDGTGCAPLSGAQVDLWQCDAVGIYSDVRDFQGLFDTRGRKFLRGYQMTDNEGTAEFLTIYPGWYEGRTPHLHFKVRVRRDAGTAYEFTSQLYFDEAVTDLVYAQPPYNRTSVRDTRNHQDGIFRRSGSGDRLMLELAQNDAGYVGTFGLGLELT